MSKYAVALFAVLLVGCHKPAPSTVSADAPKSAFVMPKPYPPCKGWGHSQPTPTWHVAKKPTHLDIIEITLVYTCKAVDGKEEWTENKLETIAYHVGTHDLIAARKCAGAMNAAQRPYGESYRDGDYAIKDIIKHQNCDWFADEYPQK